MTEQDEAAEAGLLEAALAEVAAAGWAGLTMTGVAARAGLPLAQVYKVFPTPLAVLDRLGRRLDRAMLGAEPDLLGLGARERLFELLMRRFEAMAPYREGLAKLSRAGDPALSLVALGNLDRMARWLLDAAGDRRRGPAAALARLAVIGLYLRTARVWLTDDSPDLAATLAALDRGLARLERMRGRSRGRDAAGAADEAGPMAAAAG